MAIQCGGLVGVGKRNTGQFCVYCGLLGAIFLLIFFRSWCIFLQYPLSITKMLDCGL